MELKDIRIVIPLPSRETPSVSKVDGDYKYDKQARTLEWQILEVNAENNQGVLEFNVRGDDLAAFYPISVNFQSARPFCVELKDVQSSETNSSVKFRCDASLASEAYTITYS